VQGLRDAKALLDEGIFTEQEFMLEKETLLKQHEERVAATAGAGGGRRCERRSGHGRCRGPAHLPVANTSSVTSFRAQTPL